MHFESVPNVEAFRKKIYRTPVLSAEQEAFFLQSVVKGRNFNVTRADVLQTIIDVDRTHFHELFGLDSAKEYAIRIMNLSSDMAWTFYYIALKCREVPALNAAIQRQEISLSAARRLVPVLDKDNCEVWIEKAKGMSIAKLEREVANASPLEHAHTTERVIPIPNDLNRIEFCFTQEETALLQRAREIVSQKHQQPASLREVFVESLKVLCQKHDPLEKAKRHRDRAERRVKRQPPTKSSETEGAEHSTAQRRPESSSRDENLPRSPDRVPIPAAVLHQVNLRDKRRCQFERSDGSKCGRRHFLDYHHIIHVSDGGTNDPENIITYCSRCHRRLHDH